MLNAFTMHSIFSTMPSKNAVTMPLGTGAFFISIKKQFNSLIYSLNPFIMKKKVFSLMMTLLLAFMGVAKADVVTIGDGTSTTYVTPFNSLWGYSFVEQIFTADEIGTAGTINAISFNLQSTDSQTNQVDVFMKAVSRNTFSGNTDFESVTASDMVFSGTVTFNNGWTTITLDTPFQYDGISNTSLPTVPTSRLTSRLVVAVALATNSMLFRTVKLSRPSSSAPARMAAGWSLSASACVMMVPPSR